MYDASVKQGTEKVMAWTGIVNGRVLPLVWFPKGVSVNSDIYLELLRNVLWPFVDEEDSSKRYYTSKIEPHPIVPTNVSTSYQNAFQIE